MGRERPKAPLWPEGLRKDLKLPPVENQKPKALTEGVVVPVAKQPSLAEQKDRERLSKPPPAESPVQAQAEPQAPGRKRRGRKPLHPDVELFYRALYAYVGNTLHEGLSEEQIAISDQMVNETLRMDREGAPPEEIRKMKDELLLKMYPGMSLEEAHNTAREVTRKNLKDIQLPR